MTDYRDWECEPHTVGHDDQWLILACRILEDLGCDDVSNGLQDEFDKKRRIKVNVFERDGYETDEGKIVAIEGDIYTIKCGDKTYRIPKPTIEISLTARGNSLEKYLVEK